MIDQAMHFAVVAHSGVMRKGTNQPYLLHVLEVAAITAGILSRSGLYDEDVVCAAILHDVGEDARVGREAFATIFNQRVAELVRAMTEDKGRPWKDRKQHTIDELTRETDMDKKTIALADKLSNIRSLRTDYDQLGEELWERFTEKKKSEQGWYYHSLVHCFREMEYLPEFREFSELVALVFPESMVER